MRMHGYWGQHLELDRGMLVLERVSDIAELALPEMHRSVPQRDAAYGRHGCRHRCRIAQSPLHALHLREQSTGRGGGALSLYFFFSNNRFATCTVLLIKTNERRPHVPAHGSGGSLSRYSTTT